jgi:hypothetical protein
MPRVARLTLVDVDRDLGVVVPASTLPALLVR